MKHGLTSVTFRSKTPEEIVALVAKAGLDGIEWAGDVHVPPDAISNARHVRMITQDAGLAVPSYGSYYRAGDPKTPEDAFTAVLATAIVLGVDTIRVWAGTNGSAETSADDREKALDDLCRIGAMARDAGITVGCEYHCNTLTDTTESALQLAKTVAESNVKLYWQPPNGASIEYCRAGLEVILPYFCHLHMFSWDCTGDEITRLPLADGKEWWKEYLQLIVQAAPDSWALLEFVKDDSAEQFLEDAGTLKEWIEENKQRE